MSFREIGIILNTLAVSVFSASAPRDAASFCTDVSLASSMTPPPVHPANFRILLDSYNYINLLPPHNGSVWQEVNNDNNNVAGRGTEWTQNTTLPCRQAVRSCGFNSGPQDNWVITQYINKTTGTSRVLSQVSMIVEFELFDCPALICEKTFLVYIYETRVVNDALARNTSRYQQVTRVTTNTGQKTLQNMTIELNVDTSPDGFYLAIVDEGTCVGVTRVIVYYNVCPREVVAFVIRPETVAPNIERLSHPLPVLGICVSGASPENNQLVMLNCNQGGVWTPVLGSGCRCNTGFIASEDGQSCIGCPAGMYFSVRSQECQVCPENSQIRVFGRTECPCFDGFYRASGEVDFACTQPPSRPRNLVITSTTSTSISLAWDPPESLGGRNDTRYALWYQEEGRSERVRAGTVNDTIGNITDLRDDTRFIVFVVAENGVSDLAMGMANNTVQIATNTGPGCPVGMYLSVSFQQCLVCPGNSEGEVYGLSECPCLDGYYRAFGEVDLACTQPPSEARNLIVTSIMSTSIIVAWDPPEFLGGRNDIRYILWYEEEGSNGRVRVGTVDTMTGLITGLRPDTQYIVFVGATNGVSELAVEDQSLNTIQITANTSNNGCPVGMYLSMSLQECRVCPNNSMSEVSGLSQCPCLEGYSRDPGEEDLPCTKNPTGGSVMMSGIIIAATVSVIVFLIVIALVVIASLTIILHFKRKPARKPAESYRVVCVL